MNGLEKYEPLGFLHGEVPESCHVCLIYDNEEKRKKIVLDYLSAGLRQGEVIRYFTDNTSPEAVRSWFSESGMELMEAEGKGAFAISAAVNFYCPEGRFNPQKLIDLAYQRYDMAKAAGFKGSRASGEMSWALKGIPDSDRFLEYEALLNTINTDFPHTGMCQYDARLFDGATLLKVLQVHPYVIANGQVVENPYYLKMEEQQAK